MNYRPHSRQYVPFLSGPTFPVPEPFPLALSYSLDALCSKSVHQPFSNQPLPHSFLNMPGCMGLLPRNLRFDVQIETPPQLWSGDPARSGRADLPTIFRTLFQVPYTATPLFATLTKTAGCVPKIPNLELPPSLQVEARSCILAVIPKGHATIPGNSSMEKKR